MSVIKKVTVCGSGIMGGNIAANLANLGLEVYMLDIRPNKLTEEQVEKGYTMDSPGIRNLVARSGLNKVLTDRISGIPIAFFSPGNASNVTIGNYDDHAKDFMSKSDWIIEVVSENMGIKKRVFDQIEEYRNPETAVSSNTSGIQLKKLAEGRSQEFKEHFLLTHFFHPVRFMNLVEITGLQETKPEVIQGIENFF